MDKRLLEDRRKQPTPALSRYIVAGRRETIRRVEEQKKGGYIDRYSPVLLFFIVSILGLNVLDSLFTMMILDQKGIELNPVVQSLMDLYGHNFWIWKFALVSFCLVLLCHHCKFRAAKKALIAICSIYLTVVLYQVYLLTCL